MEHEVNVPFSVGSVRAALAEPERVARCVPGLQLDGVRGEGDGAEEAAGAGGTLEGRLRLRIGGSTITYRGSVTVTPHGEEFAVEGGGTEARGSGAVRLDLTVVPRRGRDGEGTRLVCSGKVESEGRLAEFEEKPVTAAGQRLLDRFGAALGESIRDDPPAAQDSPGAPAAEPAGTEPPDAASASASASSGGIGEPDDNERAIPGIPGPGPETGGTSDTADSAPPSSPSGTSADDGGAADGAAADGGEASRQAPGPDDAAPTDGSADQAGVFDVDIPPSSLDPFEDDDDETRDGAPAEAAHARRTMIGRSAEEVDHAPPRGRYAPVPVAESTVASATLRWAGPAAAVVVAGAVVLGRALRRRR